MNLEAYLRTRHNKVNSLTKKEAELLSISYPLGKGWVKRYANIEIPSEMMTRLNEAREQSKLYRVEVKNRQAPPLKLSAKQKKQQKAEIAKLVGRIVAHGCKNAERMTEHLTRTPTR